MLRIVLFLTVLGAVFGKDEANSNISKLVNTASGPVKGYKNSDTGIYEFLSIPYATAPTGEHKFKAPNPPPIWIEPLEAIERNIICPQASTPFVVIENKTMLEDCLIANVYVPDTDENNLPVVVYVHGGAFQVGFGDLAKPKELVVEHNIIVVTFNYRLGAHGFLCLGTEDVPGNAGLKDQVALLKWVKKNIDNFGGNANDVTIAGYSAGSISVDILMISKAAEGLFTKVIPESGGNIASAVIQADPVANAKWFANSLNFTNEDINSLEHFYKMASMEMLTSDSFFMRKDSTFVFTPCVERRQNDTSAEVIIDESPIKILKKGTYKKVPLLYGFSNMEGLFRIGFFDFWKDAMNANFSDFLPTDLKFENVEEKNEVVTKIKEFYFGDQPVSNENVLSYVDYFTDVIFAYPMLKAVELHVENGHNQIYLYKYSFVDENTPFVPYTKVRGANHCSQTIAVFGGRIPGYTSTAPLTEQFKKIASTVRQLWANFIKTGNPVPEGSSLASWPPVSGDLSPHMSIANDLQLRGSLLKYRTRFWDNIYAKHYRGPMSPQS